jgi:hypothetical protein
MSGFYFLAVVGVWFWVSVVITRAVARHVRPGPKRALTACLLFLALLVFPVLDEIIGGFQFRALCARNPNFEIGVADPRGRTTRYSANPSNEIVPGAAIRIYHTRDEYTDVNTGELVVRLDNYLAKGGLFIRALGISENNSPLTIGRPSCSPQKARGETVSRTLGFSVIN